MFRLVVLSCAVAACAAQNVDPKNAKILKEQRFNAGDGRAGAAFATEDGHIFREETAANGDRIGQYSYIGEDGQTYTVKYSAGKDGFRILEGDHIPLGANGLQAAAFGADQEEIVSAPVAVQQPAQPIQRVAQPEPNFVDYEDVPVDPNFNPFINPHDPTHRNFQFNSNAAKFNPASPIAQQQSLVPPCADCEGVNPFINPFDASHNQGGFLAGVGAGVPVQRQQIPVAPQQPAFQVPIQISTTPSPRHFFPPGKLALNRFETGFNFDFES